MTDIFGILRTAAGTGSSVMKHDLTLLDQLAAFLGTLEKSEDDLDEQEIDEDDEPRQPRVGREAAFEAYARAIRAQARAAVSGRSIGQNARSGKVSTWIGGRNPPADELRSLGQSLQVQSSARHFVNPMRHYFDRMPVRYRAGWSKNY